MIKTIKSSLTIVLLTFIAAMVFGSAHAGVSTDKDKNGKSDEKLTELASSQLRCWQYGKLIFEETGWIIDQSRSDRERMVLVKATNRSETLFLSGANNSTCLYRK